MNFSTRRETAKSHQQHKTITASCDDRKPQLASKFSESTPSTRDTLNTRQEQQHQESGKIANSISEAKHANDTEYQKYRKYEEYLANCAQNRNDANFTDSLSAAKQQSKSFNSSAVPFSITNFKSNSVEPRKSPSRHALKTAYDIQERDDRNDELSIKENFNLIYQLLNPINYDNPNRNAKAMELGNGNYLYYEDFCGKRKLEEETVILFCDLFGLFNLKSIQKNLHLKTALPSVC